MRWQSLGGGPIVGDVSAGRNADGRIEVFALFADGSLNHIWQLSPGGSWSTWAPLGVDFVSPPVVASNADGRLEVFSIGPQHQFVSAWQTTPGGTWNGWSSVMPGEADSFAICTDGTQRLAAFANLRPSPPSQDESLVIARQTTGTRSGWTNPVTIWIGVTSPQLLTGRNLDGRIEVFYSIGSTVFHLWETTINGAFEFGSLGDGGAPIATGANADGRQEVFARSAKGDLVHTWQTAPNNGWSGWHHLSGAFDGKPVIGRNADGRLDVFANAPGMLHHIWQTAPNNGWSQLYKEPAKHRASAIINNLDGRLELFAITPDGTLWHTWQTSANNGWRA